MTLTPYDITGEAFWFQRYDVDTLRQLVLTLPPSPVVVNIGAGFGTSALTIVEARADAFVFSIDICERPDEETHLRQAGLWDQHRVVRILGRSQDVGARWPGTVAMVFVDGDHTYIGVFNDATIWLPCIRPGGIIAFHDYGYPALPSVAWGVDAVMANYEVILHNETLIAYRVPE
jgi:predicted O-methyltransferase YrrM